jgi:NitT/TauT family transport system permease protein
MKKFLLPLVAGLLFIGTVYAIRWQIDLNYPSRKFILPKPHEAIVAAWEHRDELIPATISTAKGAAVGFVSAVVVSLGLALLLSLSSWIRASLFPYLMMLQMTPIIVVAPILLIWVGQGLVSVQEIIHLRLPAALPYFFTGLRISAILAPIGAVVGDFFAGNAAGGIGGLGFMTVIYSSNLDTPALFATAGICCGLGFTLAGLVNLANWYCLRHWHDSFAQRDR